MTYLHKNREHNHDDLYSNKIFVRDSLMSAETINSEYTFSENIFDKDFHDYEDRIYDFVDISSNGEHLFHLSNNEEVQVINKVGGVWENVDTGFSVEAGGSYRIGKVGDSGETLLLVNDRGGASLASNRKVGLRIYFKDVNDDWAVQDLIGDSPSNTFTNKGSTSISDDEQVVCASYIYSASFYNYNISVGTNATGLLKVLKRSGDTWSDYFSLSQTLTGTYGIDLGAQSDITPEGDLVAYTQDDEIKIYDISGGTATLEAEVPVTGEPVLLKFFKNGTDNSLMYVNNVGKIFVMNDSAWTTKITYPVENKLSTTMMKGATVSSDGETICYNYTSFSDATKIAIKEGTRYVLRDAGLYNFSTSEGHLPIIRESKIARDSGDIIVSAIKTNTIGGTQINAFSKNSAYNETIKQIIREELLDSNPIIGKYVSNTEPEKNVVYGKNIDVDSTDNLGGGGGSDTVVALGNNLIVNKPGIVEVGQLFSNQSERAVLRTGVISKNGTNSSEGFASFSIPDKNSKLTDGGSTIGEEESDQLPREMYSIRRDGNDVYIDVNIAGTVKTLSLGTLT